ncbi:MAG: hypothetical protein RBQ67_04100 [Candidatus Cloacimonadaceae bacterium]|jgi:hypothetical protein|nr:hypothetical protein [Candidatus Cloacimonadota bacterium]MDY0319152.1 hypothetical protein [Candidatus Cloacimonadaceae bacterium]
MTKLPLLLLIILIALSLSSCDTDDDHTLSQKEIRDILYDISLDFQLGNVPGIMDHVHQDYLHKGQFSWHLNQEILDRIGRFQILDIEVVYIEIDGDYAIAHTLDHYSSSTEQYTYQEPEDTGYFSYFYRSKGSWLIYGNQRWFKAKNNPKPMELATDTGELFD